ncbi:MAG TPA: hypothetical protein VFU10_11140 [Gaiellaceae bacterium]|nr:hypothetical protein [Gaiellaceae bacterium]
MARAAAVLIAFLGLGAAACGGSGESTSTLSGADTEPLTSTSDADFSALMKGLAVGRHTGYDRVTFTFENVVPGYVVSYVEPPIKEDGSGNTVNVAGSDYVQVRMQPASGFDLNQGEGVSVYKGPKRISGADAGTAVVKDVVRTGDFEAVLTWTIGLAGKVGYTVQTLESPPRLVIDFDNS